MEDIMGMVKQDEGWRLPDELWEQMAPLLPQCARWSPCLVLQRISVPAAKRLS
jgi:hypothetical protein|tara:strand:- start:4243 stop:4401 length:159 start_codon:yes stop_codon:yes gene_type:complete